MKLLVPIKRVPSADEPVRVRPDGTGIEDDGRAFMINPFDAIALEEALRIRDSHPDGGEVLAVCIGDSEVEAGSGRLWRWGRIAVCGWPARRRWIP